MERPARGWTDLGGTAMDTIPPSSQLPSLPPGVDETKPNAARVYDWYLGGFHNFEVDREMGRQAIASWPELPRIMRANRAFLQRAVTHLVDVGVRQFLDLGSGIPTVGSVHETAQALAPESRVVYVDLDPVAVAHATSLLSGNEGAVAVCADLRSAGAVLGHPEVVDLLDLNEPVAVLMVAVLHFVQDRDDPAGVVGGYRDALAPGSRLAISHATHEPIDDELAEEHVALYRQTSTPMTMRTRRQVSGLFEGWHLIDPGVVLLEEWEPGRLRTSEEDPRWCPAWGGVATLP